jgi:hypothetical protein
MNLHPKLLLRFLHWVLGRKSKTIDQIGIHVMSIFPP